MTFEVYIKNPDVVRQGTKQKGIFNFARFFNFPYQWLPAPVGPRSGF